MKLKKFCYKVVRSLGFNLNESKKKCMEFMDAADYLVVVGEARFKMVKSIDGTYAVNMYTEGKHGFTSRTIIPVCIDGIFNHYLIAGEFPANSMKIALITINNVLYELKFGK